MGRRGVLTTLIVVVVVFGFGGCLLRKAWESNSAIQLVSGRCSASGVRLDAEQMANAATVSAVGLRRGVKHRAIIVALSVALQESKLRNLEHLGESNDHDSVGLFQQRPSQGWGTAEQIMDQRYAADKFYTALLKVKGWESMRVTDAAQRVQRSAYPDAYQKWADDSEVLAAAFAGQAQGVVTCSPDGRPQSPTVDAVEKQLQRDFARKAPKVVKEGQILRVPVKDATATWQFAHWLVAHSAALGINSVTVPGRRWTPDQDAWQSTDDQTSGQVTALITS